MSTFLKAYDTIVKVRATSSKKAKQELLKEALDDMNFAALMQAAYDPTTTYGFDKVKEPFPTPEALKDEQGFVLDDIEIDDASWVVATLDQGGTRCHYTFFGLLQTFSSGALTGKAAQTALMRAFSTVGPRTAWLLWACLRKDMRAGFSVSTLNKALPGLIEEFPYMRCTLASKINKDKLPWDKGMLSQEKADGMYATFKILETETIISSRQGSRFDPLKFPEIVEELRGVHQFQNHVTNGELLVTRDGVVLPREEGNGVLNRVLCGGGFAPNERPIYKVWDCIPVANHVADGTYKVAYKIRFLSMLQGLKSAGVKSVTPIPTRIVRSWAEAIAHSAELIRAGKEGTVIKNPDGFWMDGDSKDQIKVKLEVDVDLFVVDIEKGKEGTKNEGRPGALLCATSDHLLYASVAIKNEAMRAEVEANPNDWIGRVVTVRSNDILEPSPSNKLHSLFLPRMAEAAYRLDKDEADSLDRVKAIFDSAKGIGEDMKEAA